MASPYLKIQFVGPFAWLKVIITVLEEATNINAECLKGNCLEDFVLKEEFVELSLCLIVRAYGMLRKTVLRMVRARSH